MGTKTLSLPKISLPHRSLSLSTKPLSLTLTALSHSTKPLSLTALSHRHRSLSLSHRHRSLSLSHRHRSLTRHRSLVSLSLSLSRLSALTLSPSLPPLSLSLSHRSLTEISPLSLTEISLPNPKSLPSLRLRLRRGRRVCRRRLPEIGASEALTRRRTLSRRRCSLSISLLRSLNPISVLGLISPSLNKKIDWEVQERRKATSVGVICC
ncbi:hypothetical protein Scep_023694 [Stephania cephalantha]|uniref:Uncharacterized protein n=1 Tax=Stephania cephalantha TaxID=152367 RepID=A0AAP0EVN0_9MAGN